MRLLWSRPPSDGKPLRCGAPPRRRDLLGRENRLSQERFWAIRCSCRVHVPDAKPVRRFSKVTAEFYDRIDVRLLRRLREVADRHIFDQCAGEERSLLIKFVRTHREYDDVDPETIS